MATRMHCERALNDHEEHLGSLANVVGLGIVPEDQDDPTSSRLAVAVYVTRKVPRSRLKEEDLVPETLEIHGRRGPIRVRTRVIEQGEVQLEEGASGEVGKEPI